MKIMVVGASGTAGSQIAKEALSRGHQVTAVGRTEEKLTDLAFEGDVQLLIKDAFDLIKDELAAHDVVVHAISQAPDKAYLQTDLTTKWIAEFRETTTPRFFFILGAGSLVTGKDKHDVIDDIRQLPGHESWIGIPENQFYQLKFLRDVKNVNWVGVSPGFEFRAGENEAFKLGKDKLLYSDNGESATDSRALAIAVVDEIENPQHHNERFHVVNA